ncbi:MAG: hypothetical protein HGB26_04065 [Desulfobulbaceae bacterium]|nr:hypothetical protein [Desulfobulbaceae bacterium]
MKDYESCRASLDSLSTWYDQNKGKRNEATTRLQLIDEIFFRCLDWEKTDVITEEYHSGDFTDYTLKLEGKSVLIVEAKKEGNYFEMPIGSQINYSIQSLCRDNEAFKAAVEQVSGYCQKRGVQIGLVCNGWQIVVFIANRTDGMPPLDGMAFVFSSFDEIKNNYTHFWNLLSKQGIEKRTIFKELIGGVPPKLPQQLSVTLSSSYPGIKDRNPYQVDLQIISELIFEDVVRDESLEKDFLKDCYCKSGALSEYALISKDILRTRHEYFSEKKTLKAQLLRFLRKKVLARIFLRHLQIV